MHDLKQTLEDVQKLYLIKKLPANTHWWSDELRAVSFREIGLIHPSLKKIMIRAMQHNYVHSRPYFYTWEKSPGEEVQFTSTSMRLYIRLNFLEELFS